MIKHLQAFAIFFLGISILLSSIIISTSLSNNSTENIQVENEQEQEKESQNRYEFIMIASDYFVMFDTYTGEYWMKVGSSEWEKKQSPIDLP